MRKKSDELILLLLRCDGRQAAIQTYEEETGASHARAVRHIDKIAQRHGVGLTPRWSRPLVLWTAAVATAAVLYWSVESLLTST